MFKPFLKSLLGLTASTFAFNAMAATQIEMQISKQSGVAPLAIHFDATGTTDDSVSDAFRDLRYDFNFGDPASGNWQHSGLSKNTESGGPLAAHVYDTPGTYTVTLNAGESSRQVSITVTDPNSVFSGSNTICLSTNTDMSGCPSGAQQQTGANSWPAFQDNKRYMLKAGQNFSSFGAINTGQLHNVQITRFGNGAKPITASIYLQQSSGGYSGSWISDVSVIGLDTTGIYHSISGNNILMYQNNVHGSGGGFDIAGAFNWYRTSGSYPTSLTMAKNIFVVENTSEAGSGVHTGEGQTIWMGNTLGNTQQWNVRLWQAYKTFFAHNQLSGNSSYSGKSNLKIHSTGVDPVNPDSVSSANHKPRSNYLVIANNTFNSETSIGIYATVTVEPQNNEGAEGIENVIVENNTHISGAWPGGFSAGVFGGRNITQRGAVRLGGASDAGIAHNMSALPTSWNGPYYMNSAPPKAPQGGSAPVDSDADGIADSSDNCPAQANADQANFDNDGQGDLCDLDDDNDGLPDTWEVANNLNPFYATDANQDPDADGLSNLVEYQTGTNPQIYNAPSQPDSDSDGVVDASDNCPAVANPNQANFDGDGAGDLCDLDDDNDALPDSWEIANNLNPFYAVDANQDPDADGLSNLVEYQSGSDPQIYNPPTQPDSDSDGIVDTADNCPAIANPDQANFDGDGAGDVCDLDDDNDALPDGWEIANNLNPFNAADASLDPDGDGLSNLTEYQQGSDPNNGVATTQIQLQASQQSGVAPLAVHFDATGTTDSSVSNAFRDLRYDFNFGDPTSGTWQYSGLSKNTESGGPLAAHVYDTPGTYIATLNAGDTSRQVSITVTDPNAVFSGVNTVCLSTNSDMSGCPSGALQQTGANSWPVFQDNKRYMLKAGQNFSSFGSISTGQLHNVQITRFGNGAKPVTASVYLQQSSGNYSGSWISDVSVIGLDTTGIYHSISGSNILMYQNNVHGTGGGIDIAGAFNWYRTNNTYASNLTMAKNIFVVENTSEAGSGVHTGEGQTIWMGNKLGNTQQWNVRLWQAYKTFFAHNQLFGNSSYSGKSNLKIHSTGVDPVNPDAVSSANHKPRSNYLVVANNIFNSETSTGIYATVTVEPQNDQEAEGIENVVVENNTHIYGAWPGGFSAGVFGGRNITQRGAVRLGGASDAGIEHNMSALPTTWNGPYYMNAAQPKPPQEGPVLTDSDGDGIADATDNCPALANPGQANFDNDVQGDACDIDDDNDGLPDTWEVANNLNPFYAADANQDPDVDGLSNLEEYQSGSDPYVYNPPAQSDSDNDGILDTADNCPAVANPDQSNFDGDGAGDICDQDDDNDAMPDSWEIANNLNPFNPADAAEDPDADGLSNLVEYQSVSDPHVYNPPAQFDSDNDGIPDAADNCPAMANPDQANFDGDGAGDICDPDDDNDALPDSWEIANNLNPFNAADASQDPDGDDLSNLTEYQLGSNPNVSNKPGKPDADKDRIFDVTDNCPLIANPDQADYDSDNQGDVCDTDDDNDLMPDSWETANNLNPFYAADAEQDPDQDGIVNLREYLLRSDPHQFNKPAINIAALLPILDFILND